MVSAQKNRDSTEKGRSEVNSDKTMRNFCVTEFSLLISTTIVSGLFEHNAYVFLPRSHAENGIVGDHVSALRVAHGKRNYSDDLVLRNRRGRFDQTAAAEPHVLEASRVGLKRAAAAALQQPLQPPSQLGPQLVVMGVGGVGGGGQARSPKLGECGFQLAYGHVVDTPNTDVMPRGQVEERNLVNKHGHEG